jgi:hypothetical protein
MGRDSTSMGRKLKGLALLLGLMFVPLGGWPISAILFLYAFSGLIFRGSRRKRGNTASTDAPAPMPNQQSPPAPRFKRGLSHPVHRILGLGFLGLSAVAFAESGTYSPLVFGGVGALLLLWGAPLITSGNLGSLRPVDESILLRQSFDPIHWLAIAEVKLATKQVGRALGGIDETLFVTSGADGPSVFVVVRAVALTMRGAEDSLLARLRELTRVSAPLGAYLLPVDPASAVTDLFHFKSEKVELDSKGWPSALSTIDYDLLAVESKRGGFVHSIGAYKISDASEDARANVPLARQALSRPALLWEIFQELGKKTEWQKPDGYTTFLASMFATEGETIGERVSEAGSAGNLQEVLVQSLGTPPVKMSRAQLRAIARIYS